MKKSVNLWSLLIVLLGIGFLVCPAVFAYDIGFDPDNILQLGTGLGSEDPATIAYGIINTALVFLGVITLALIIYGGFIWMLAGGNEESVTKAKKILKGAIIGLIVVLVSYSISRFVFETLVQVTQGD